MAFINSKKDSKYIGMTDQHGLLCAVNSMLSKGHNDAILKLI